MRKSSLVRFGCFLPFGKYSIFGMYSLFVAVLSLLALPAHAQGNYEIQVYGAETVAPKTTMVEVHSNYTIDGQHNTVDGVYPTNHQLHETLEITQGLNDWSGGRLLRLHQHAGRPRRAVGRRPHSPARACAG